MIVARPTKISREGALQIAQREAFVPIAYEDGWHDPKIKKRPKYSIGFGDNLAKKGDTIEMKEAFERFNLALALRTEIILKKVKVDLTQQQLDALGSLFYQGGNLKLDPMARLLNAGDYDGAAALFLDDKMATNKDGEFRQGLKKRREREHAIFTKGDYGDIGWVWKYSGNPADGHRERYDVKDNEL